MAKRYPLSVVSILVLLTFFLSFVAQSAHSQQATPGEWKLRKKAAESVIRIVAEDVNSTSFRAATEIASLLARDESGEILGCTLATIHNLHYYLQLASRMRQAIRGDRFEAFRRAFHLARQGEAAGD